MKTLKEAIKIALLTIATLLNAYIFMMSFLLANLSYFIIALIFAFLLAYYKLTINDNDNV